MMPDEAWGAVVHVSGFGFVLAGVAIVVALAVVVCWNELHVFASTRRPAEGASRVNGQESDILGQTDRAGGPGVTGARQSPEPVTFEWDWPAA